MDTIPAVRIDAGPWWGDLDDRAEDKELEDPVTSRHSVVVSLSVTDA